MKILSYNLRYKQIYPSRSAVNLLVGYDQHILNKYFQGAVTSFLFVSMIDYFIISNLLERRLCQGNYDS